MSRDGGRCFLPGLWPPSSPSAAALAPRPETGGNMLLPKAIRSSQTPQLRSGASSCGSWGPPIDGLGHRLPRSPPPLRGFAAGGRRKPPMPQLCPSCSREAVGSRVGPAALGEAALAPPPACTPALPWAGFPPPPHLQHCLEFLNRPKCETTFFLPFIIQMSG